MAAKKSNVVKFKKRPRVAMIVLAIVVIYAVFFVAIYSTKKKVETYEVNTGSLTANSKFTGIALRQESIIYSAFNGNVNYYLRESTKAKVNDIVYTVDETGRVAQLLNDATNSGDNSLSENNLKIIKNTLNSYKTSYTGSNFDEVYDLKTDLNSTVLQSINENIMANLDTIVASTGSENLFQTVRTEQSGVVVYSVDGYENLTENAIATDVFDKSKYTKTNLKSQNIINSGNPAYKMITSENWAIYCILNADDIKNYDLKNKNTVKIRFTKDNITVNTNFSLLQSNDKYYGKFILDKYMIRYATDRFIDFELLAPTTNGLKIPISSIVEKDFYTIPKDLLTSGGNTNTTGFLCDHYVNNEKVTEFIACDVYFTDEQFCYVDMNSFNQGDLIVKMDSNENYTVGTKGSLKGVYCVNTGYTIFKPIEILDQNAEYCIVKRTTSRGITVYDHIILDGSNISENVMIY